MREQLSPDNPFFRVMGKIGDFIILNIIFIISCIPVFTIGASITALYTIVQKMSRNEESYIIRGYCSCFFQNFKQASILWLCCLLSGIPLFYASVWLANFGSTRPYLFIPYIFLLMLYAFSLLYVFPLQATFENKPLMIIRNSLLTALGNLPYTVALMLIFYIPVCITVLFPGLMSVTLTFWLLIGCSLLTHCSGFVYRKVFAKYITK